MTIRVLLADDQELMRAGFRMILNAEDDIEVVGEATDGAEAVESAASLQPDVILMDVRMPHMNGIEATGQIAGESADAPRIIILTTFDLDEYVYGALQAGAAGFLLKDVPPDDLVQAIRVVAGGDAMIAPSVTRRLLEHFSAPPTTAPPERPERFDELTDRELDVLRMIARGMSNAEVAEALFVAETTVKTHVGHLLTKLGVRDRLQAVILAYECGLVEPGTT
jgi:DNA-binding NarL/FixJ family response regulator